MIPMPTYKERCYNSGAISSLPVIKAWHNFDHADRVIEQKLGMQPVNPMKITWGVPCTAPWIVHMIKDILLMLTCGSVYFQPGWTQSRGARIEYKVAVFLQMDIFMGGTDDYQNLNN